MAAKVKKVRSADGTKDMWAVVNDKGELLSRRSWTREPALRALRSLAKSQPK